MSFGVYSVQPLPDDEKPCPVCRAPMPAQAEICWLCLQQSIKAGEPPMTAKPGESPGRREPDSSHFNLSFAVIVVLVVILGSVLAYEIPGTLVVPAIVLAVVLVRSAVKSEKPVNTSLANAGQKLPPPEPSAVQLVFNWLVVVILMGSTAFSAFCAAFFAICTGGLVINQNRRAFDSFENFIAACVVGGSIAAVLGAAFVFHVARPRQRKA